MIDFVNDVFQLSIFAFCLLGLSCLTMTITSS